MAATSRRKNLSASSVLPYTVAGDPKERRFLTFGHAAALASYIAERQPRDGEEYRHGIKLNDEVVGTAVRHPDGTVTVYRKARTS